ncbi:MAG: FAD-binding oxidoreductase [Candidatus Thorarchaeota archaeon]
MDKSQIYEEVIRIIPKADVSNDPVILYAYNGDVAEFAGLADCVARPTTAQQVESIVKLAAAHKIPLIPRGAGTGTSGATAPTSGGIIIDFTKMNKILKVDLVNRTVIVQPGVVQGQLNDQLKKYGFYIPVIPGSSAMATVGGMVGNDASGRKTIRYGTTKDWVRNLEVVFPNGNRCHLSRPVLKSVAGYDLVRLLVGSEGTLAIITEVALRIEPVPQFTRIVKAEYNSLENAGKTIEEIYKSPITPSSVEILDKSALYSLKSYASTLDLVTEAEAVLLIELEGFSNQSLFEQAKVIAFCCRSAGAAEIEISESDEDNARIWESRELIGAAVNAVREGYTRVYVGEDIVVPIQKIPTILLKLRELSAKYNLPIAVFGHIGDGNLHPAITIRKDKACDRENLALLEEEIYQEVLSLDGSVTGEHGVGRARKNFLPEQLGKALDIMTSIKKAVDPDNIMNPGVIF